MEERSMMCEDDGDVVAKTEPRHRGMMFRYLGVETCRRWTCAELRRVKGADEFSCGFEKYRKKLKWVLTNAGDYVIIPPVGK